MEDDFYLKWEKHHSAFVSVFDSLYKHNILVDCTLAAEEKYIKAHRIVLMACSPYLEELLSQHCDNYPIVFLDIKFSELQAIVDFCYRGEVKLPQNELNGFIRAANTLHIKGLCSSEFNGNGSATGNKKRRDSARSSGTESSSAPKRRRNAGSVVKMENESEVSESAQVPDVSLVEDGVVGTVDAGVQSVRSDVPDERGTQTNMDIPSSMPQVNTKEDEKGKDSLAADQGSDNSDVDSDDSESSEDGEEDGEVSEMLRQGAAAAYLFPWTCNRCGEAFTTRSLYTEHRRSCIDTSNHPWTCHKCPNSYKNKKDLVRHLIYCGNEVARLVCNRCGNTYKYERGLKRHQKYCGTDMKPLKCPRCDKTYKYKRGLRRHQRRCCGIFDSLIGLPGLPVVKAESVKEPVVNSTENYYGTFNEPWTCDCGKSYKYKRSYLKHIEFCPGQSVQQTHDIAAELKLHGDGVKEETSDVKNATI